MDITTIYKVIICIGILQTCSLYHDDGIVFQVTETMEWSQAEQTCQKNNGKLFKPNETSFDVPLFSECNFNDELWVAATYIKGLEFETASMQSDSVIRCEMCTIGETCGTTCLYKACENRCKSVCTCKNEHNCVLSDIPYSWTEGRKWCSEHLSEIGDRIENASSLFFSGICIDRCLWTRNVIKVYFQTTLAQGNEPGGCGILHNGTLSFTSCNRHLHPLCERVAKTALETPRLSFSEGNISCISMNETITYTTTTEASGRTNGTNSTIITSSTNGTSTVANEIAKRTTIRSNEELSSLLVPVGATTSKHDLEDSSHKSDTGIIIGSVVGSVVFLMMTVIVIICVRRKVLQRTGNRKSNHDSQNMKTHTTDITHKPICTYKCQDVSIESESGFTPIAQLESKCEGSRRDSVGQKANPGKPASMIDPEGSNVNYATVNKNVNVNSSNLTINVNYVSYDHLNDIRESRDDNVSGNIYDNRL